MGKRDQKEQNRTRTNQRARISHVHQQWSGDQRIRSLKSVSVRDHAQGQSEVHETLWQTKNRKTLTKTIIATTKQNGRTICIELQSVLSLGIHANKKRVGRLENCSVSAEPRICGDLQPPAA